MADAVERSITLPPELAAAVDGAVDAGEYASASELISDALREWQGRRETLGYSIEELREFVKEGIDSGPAKDGPTIMDRILAERESKAARNVVGDLPPFPAR